MNASDEIKLGLTWYILVDIEGIIGVENLDLKAWNGQLALWEIDFIAKYLQRWTPREIVVCDLHDDGRNIPLLEGLNVPYKIIRGINAMVQHDFNDGYGVLIGFHSKANGEGRFAHSFRSDIAELYYGETLIGEVGIFTRWLRRRNVEVLMVSGEGDFIDELDENITVHRVMREEKNFQTLLMALEKMENTRLVRTHQSMNLDDLVTVVPKNEDYVDFMDDSKGNRMICSHSVVYLGIDGFVDDLHNLCVEMNWILSKIVSRNINEISDLSTELRERFTKERAGKFFRKDVSLVTRRDLDCIYELIDGKNV